MITFFWIILASATGRGGNAFFQVPVSDAELVTFCPTNRTGHFLYFPLTSSTSPFTALEGLLRVR